MVARKPYDFNCYVCQATEHRHNISAAMSIVDGGLLPGHNPVL